MEEGCGKIFKSAVVIGAIILMIMLSIAGVSSMGIVGIFVGPVVVIIGVLVLSCIYS